jgi:membrane fusion protein (multidrug efflux system)
MIKFIGVAGAISLLAVVYFLASKTDRPQMPAVTKTVEQSAVAAEGKVEALPGLEVQVGAELTGRIEKFLVKEGDSVQKGQTIARLESKDILAKLDEAEAELVVARARLEEVASGSRPEEIEEAAAAVRAAVAEMELAKTNFERFQKLHADGVVSKAIFDGSTREYTVATNRLREAEQRKVLLEKGPKEETLALHRNMVQRAEAAKEYLRRLLDKTIVAAPLSGKVIHKYMNEGEVVYTESPLPLVVIANTERLRVNAEVDETDIGKIHVGDAVEIRSDAYPDLMHSGVILEIADYVGARKIVPNNPAKNLDMKVVQVKISLPAGSPLRLGMTVDVRINSKGS